MFMIMYKALLQAQQSKHTYRHGWRAIMDATKHPFLCPADLMVVMSRQAAMSPA